MSLSCEQSAVVEAKKLAISQQLNQENKSQKVLQVTSLKQEQESDALDKNTVSATEQLEIIDLTINKIRYLYQGVIKTRSFVFDDNPASPSLWLSNVAGNLQFFDRSLSSNKAEQAGSDQVLASMDGAVIDVLVKEGEQVVCGDVIAIIEAMKMEHLLKASVDGRVEKVLTATGNQVKARQLLVQLQQSS